MIRRNITDNLLAALGDSPLVLLNGARQTGKSALVKSVMAKEHPARYLALDDISVLAAVRYDPSGFLSGLDGPQSCSWRSRPRLTAGESLATTS